MTETNLRTVMYGGRLYLDIRIAQVSSPDNSPDNLERACTALWRRGLAAIPCRGKFALLVATRNPIPSLEEKGDDWLVEIKDSGQARRLRFAEPEEALLIALLLDRCLLIELGRRTDLWWLDSHHIWYEPNPFKTVNDIDAIQRYEFSATAIQGVGIGMGVDISTAFFSALTVADFHRNDLNEAERRRFLKQFESLTQRQQRQKGTLLYDYVSGKKKCHFVDYPVGLTCATTGRIPVRGVIYDSLLDYYQKQYPQMPVAPDDPVARVSFAGLERPQFVAANRLRLRVMNDSLPRGLKQVDKIDPLMRSQIIAEELWQRLGDFPLGRHNPPVASRFWQPTNGKLIHLQPPDLLFGNQKILSAPHNEGEREYKDYFRKRIVLLDHYGCYKVPPAIPRIIHFAATEETEAAATRLAEEMTTRLSQWTKKNISHELKTYDSLTAGIAQLREENSSKVVVFVFKEADPAAYFTLSYELKGWRVKRITEYALNEHYEDLLWGERELRKATAKKDSLPRGVRDWQSFVEMNSLDVLQRLGCVPWTVASPMNYEAQLAIDVGWDRRYFALSLMICRSQEREPTFYLDTMAHIKADQKTEAINDVVFGDKLLALFQKAMRDRNQFIPLQSVLVLRDGRECGGEMKTIAAFREKLIEAGGLTEDGRMDVVDFHKRSAKSIRLWDRVSQQDVRNVLEGKALLLDDRTAIVVNTGAATLSQGTAEPLMLVARGEGINMKAVAADVNAGSHLNYSSPGRAQRLPLVLKRTDEELESRAAQEIRRMR